MMYETGLVIAFAACCAIFTCDFLYGKYKVSIDSKTALLSDRFVRFRYLDSLLVFIASFLIMFILNKHVLIEYNNYSYFADALLQGRLDMPDLPPHLERVIYNGKIFLHLAPGPAIMLLPFIAIWGVGFNMNVVSLFFGALSVAVFYNILEIFRFDDTRTRLWLTLLFGFGTIHFWLSVIGHSWFFGQVMTTFFLLLAMLCIFQKTEEAQVRWFLLSGFFFGCSVSCRITIIASGFFFTIFILAYCRKNKVRSLFLFAAGALVPGSIYMYYNYSRFETIMDISYLVKYIYENPDSTLGVFGLAGPQYAPYNLYSLFLLAPDFVNNFPFIAPSLMGVSLTFSSPALYYAVKAKGERAFVILLWLSVAVSSLPFVFSSGNGFTQFGMRYAMDFVPFLMLLAASALRELTSVKKIVILLCVWLNCWGILFWNWGPG